CWDRRLRRDLRSRSWLPGTANDGCDRYLWNFLRHTGPPAEEPAAGNDGARLPGFHRGYCPLQTRYTTLIVLLCAQFSGREVAACKKIIGYQGTRARSLLS